jgi:membrane carboxypeptidase/penicillin-binding protein
VPSLALGSSEVTLLELVRAYGVLAAGGNLAAFQTLQGRAAYGDPPPVTPTAQTYPAVDPAAAFLVTSALQGVVERGTGRGLWQYARPYGIAGKTGTSNDWRDAWFIAYSPELVVGAWVGFDDGRSLGLTGAGAALPLVARFLGEVRERLDGRQFEIPDGITESYVTLAGSGWFWECGQREYFLEGTEPDERGCLRFEIPLWDDRDDRTGRLSRRAMRLLDQLLAQAREHYRNR